MGGIKKRIKRSTLCAGDLRYQINIISREQQAITFGQLEPTEQFVVIASPFAGIETVSGTSRFKGINIEEKATHLFYILYRADLKALEAGNFFVQHREKYYRILRVTENDEDMQYIIIQTTERGDEALEASQA